MTDDLRSMLLDSLDKESRRFAAEHPGAEAPLYERAIAPRRAARRALEAGGALVVAGAVAVGAFVVAHTGASLEPSPPAATPTSALLARDWAVLGADVDPDGTAADLADVWGSVRVDAPACAALDTYAGLAGRAELGGEPVSLGTVASPSGSADDALNGVHARSFATADDATSYLDELASTAARCAEAAARTGLDVTVADVGIAATAGTGVRIDVTDPGAEGTWRLWVHVQGSEAVAVVTEPHADDLGAQVIRAWFTAAAG
ncbi:hypothetical protein [Demequina maris]|uniref:hypothetical protein n=1 Tax=Demequina maris TaxID=1638982 RepID=UPI0007828BF9|nr:hypothetical protein [Demequina maris]